MTEEVADFYGFEDTEVENTRFAVLKYESAYSVINLGSVNVIFASSLAILAIFSLLSLCRSAACECVRKFGKRQLEKSCCYRFLAFLDGSMIFLLISAFLNLWQVRYGDSELNSAFYVSATIIFACLLQLMCFTILFTCCKTRLNSVCCLTRFGYPYENTKSLKTHWVMAHPIAISIRIWLFSGAIISL